MDTKALRQKILDLAIRGKLVPQDPNDEPASMLLGRIRQQKQQMVKEGKLKPKDIKNDSVIFVGEDNLHYEKFADGSVKCIEDEIPFDLPEGWAWERLGNVSTIARGGSPRPIEDYLTHDADGINWIKIGDAEKDGKYILHTKEKIKPAGLSKTRHVHSGDFLLTNSMSFGRPYILKTDGCIHDGWLVIGNIDTVFNQDYLYYALSSGFMYATLSLLAAGSTVKNLKSDTVRSVFFPIPPIGEQTRIAQQLEQLITFIDTINAEKGNLVDIINQSKAIILNLAIRGQLVPQDPADEPASVLLDRIRTEKEELIRQGKTKRDKKESVIFRGEDNSYYEKIGDKVENISDEIPFELPDGWAFVRLKELCELVSGRDLSPSEYNADGDGIPYITGASNFANGKVSLVRWTTTPQVITKTGDLLLTCKGTIGEMALNNFGDAHIARQVMAIRNTFTLNPEYLALCITAHISAIKNVAKGLIPGISREDILNLILPVPSPNYQAKIVERVAEVTNILSAIEKSLS